MTDDLEVVLKRELGRKRPAIGEEACLTCALIRGAARQTHAGHALRVEHSDRMEAAARIESNVEQRLNRAAEVNVFPTSSRPGQKAIDHERSIGGNSRGFCPGQPRLSQAQRPGEPDEYQQD